MTRRQQMILVSSIIGVAIGLIVTLLLAPSPPAVVYTHDPATHLCFARVRWSDITNVVPCTDEVIHAAQAQR